VSEQGLLIAHFLGAVVMTAVIWFVQLVQYPMFARIGPLEFPAYATEYQRRVGWIVIGPMLLEVATAVGLVIWHSSFASRPAMIAALILLGVAWLFTFFVQVPIHERLRLAKDEAAIHRLVSTNWGRTIAWTGRAVLTGALVFGGR